MARLLPESPPAGTGRIAGARGPARPGGSSVLIEAMPRSMPGGSSVLIEAMPCSIPDGSFVLIEDMPCSIPGGSSILIEDMPCSIPGGSSILIEAMPRSIPGGSPGPVSVNLLLAWIGLGHASMFVGPRGGQGLKKRAKDVPLCLTDADRSLWRLLGMLAIPAIAWYDGTL